MKDQSSLLKYVALKAPREGGSVYCIMPVDDGTKVKYVHCSALKAMVDRENLASSPMEESAPTEESCPKKTGSDHDLFLFQPGEPGP